MSRATTASAKPSCRVPWKVGDAVVGTGNAGRTNVKEWTSLPMLELLTMASRRRDWNRISAESSHSLPPPPPPPTSQAMGLKRPELTFCFRPEQRQQRQLSSVQTFNRASSNAERLTRTTTFVSVNRFHFLPHVSSRPQKLQQYCGGGGGRGAGAGREVNKFIAEAFVEG